MILSKQEFQKEYGYDSLSSVYRLIRDEKLELTPDGMIDTELKINAELIKIRKQKLNKGKKEQESVQKVNKKRKSDEQLSLELNILNAKVEKEKRQNELLGIKIAKEKGDVIEISVLNRVIINVFESFFKTLCNFPNLKADEIIDIVRANENPKEELVKILTGDLMATIQETLANAKETTKKFYKE